MEKIDTSSTTRKVRSKNEVHGPKVLLFLLEYSVLSGVNSGWQMGNCPMNLEICHCNVY